MFQPDPPDIDLTFDVPLPIGTFTDEVYLAPMHQPPRIVLVRLNIPENPGMPPVYHASLLDAFDVLKLTVPYAGQITASYEASLTSAYPITQMPGLAAPEVEIAEPDEEDEPDEDEFVPETSIIQTTESLFVVALYFAVALGTLFLLGLEVRYAVVWTVMAGFGVLFTLADRANPLEQVYSSDLGWGMGLGFVIGLPLFIILNQGLADTTRMLFPTIALPNLILFLVFAAPLGESFLFRGMLQERRGFIVSVAAAGLSTLLVFWPAITTIRITLAIFIVIVFTALAAMYGYVRVRYSLAAAVACQIIANIMLMVLPVVFNPLP